MLKYSIQVNQFKKDITLTNLTRFNILLGKNGSGKSRIMQAVNFSYHDTLYIQPERGGWFEGAEDVKKEEYFDSTAHQKIVLVEVDTIEKAKNYQPTDEIAIYLIKVANSNPTYGLELFRESHEDAAIDRGFFLERKAEKICFPGLVLCADGTIKMWGRTNPNLHGAEAWDLTILDATQLNLSHFPFPSDHQTTGWISDTQIPKEVFMEIAAKGAHIYETLFAAWMQEGEPQSLELEEKQSYISIPQDFSARIIVDKNTVNQMIAVLECPCYEEETLAIDPNTRLNRVTLNQYPHFRMRTIEKLQQFVMHNRENTVLLEELESVLNEQVTSIRIRINPNFDREKWKNQDGQSFEEYQNLKEVICFQSKIDGTYIHKEKISSGENELIAMILAIFIFVKKQDNPLKTNAESLPNQLSKLLLLDEPEPHLHPDSQVSFIEWLYEFARQNSFPEQNIAIIIATHSTPILGALNAYDDVSVCFLAANMSTNHERALKFNQVTEELTNIVPIFGAHPLSRVFNESPILLVEGEDEERIWSQAVRTSFGALKLHPCVTTSISKMAKYETKTNEIISSIYDNPIAYSLRDRDECHDNTLILESVGHVHRYRLRCRASENLLLTDEVLDKEGLNFSDIFERLKEWVENQNLAPKKHPYYSKMKEFYDALSDIEGRDNARMLFDLKQIRILIQSELLRSNKSWELLIGQTIGELVKKNVLEIMYSVVPSNHLIDKKKVYLYLDDDKITIKYVNISNHKISTRGLSDIEPVEAEEIKHFLRENGQITLNKACYLSINAILTKLNCPVYLGKMSDGSVQVPSGSILHYLGDFVGTLGFQVSVIQQNKFTNSDNLKGTQTVDESVSMGNSRLVLMPSPRGDQRNLTTKSDVCETSNSY